jgi:hypothetical protein
VFEIDPDEVHAEVAVVLHEGRTVRVVEDAERDVSVVYGRSDPVFGL